MGTRSTPGFRFPVPPARYRAAMAAAEVPATIRATTKASRRGCRSTRGGRTGFMGGSLILGCTSFTSQDYRATGTGQGARFLPLRGFLGQSDSLSAIQQVESNGQASCPAFLPAGQVVSLLLLASS